MTLTIVDHIRNLLNPKSFKGWAIVILLSVITFVLRGTRLFPFLQSVTISKVLSTFVDYPPPASEESSIYISSNPIETEILIDGILRAKTPKTIPFSLGKHTVELRKEGYDPFIIDIDIPLQNNNMLDNIILNKLPIKITIQSDPSGASISINDQQDQQCLFTPCQFQIAPGEYSIKLTLDGYEPIAKPEIFDLNQPRVREYKLNALPAKISINSSPEGANVIVDGDDKASTPNILLLSSGNHYIKLRKDGYFDGDTVISVSPAEVINLPLFILKPRDIAPVNPDGLYGKDKLCGEGDLLICNELGDIYYFGDEAMKDFKRAEYYFKMSCRGKNSEGCYKIASLYYNLHDFNQSFDYYKKACDYGHAKACYHLGSCYKNADCGLKTNLRRARKYFHKACDGGEKYSCSESLIKP